MISFIKERANAAEEVERLKSREVDINAFFTHVQEFASYYNFATRDKFVKAILRLYLTKGYSESRMLKKLRIASAIVHEQPRVDMMAKEMLKLYNYKSKSKLVVK